MFESAKKRLLAAYAAEPFASRTLELDAKRNEFLLQFPPDKLLNLQGRDILEFFHGVEKREGLFYHLEHGQITGDFGNIWGGSALKFKVYRGDDGDWRLQGAGGKPERCSEAEAIAVTEKLAYQLGYALDMVTALGLEGGELSAWEEFEEKVNWLNIAEPFHGSGDSTPIPALGWAHKYLALVHPDLFSFHHKKEALAQHLVRLGVEPKSGRFLLDWQWRQLRLEDEQLRECHPVVLMHAAYDDRGFGYGVGYWRIGTEEGDEKVDRWPVMRDGGFGSIGWAKLGDLSVALEGLGETEARERLVQLLAADYGDKALQVLSKWARQIYGFYAKMQVGDRIIAMKGRTLLGVGTVKSGYFHVDDLQPHHRKVEWRKIEPSKWEDSPGHMTTVNEFTHKYDKALHVESILASEPEILPVIENATPPTSNASPDDNPKSEQAMVPLTQTEQRIFDVLERKGQVILFGPPGTGKTFHARRTAQELLARDVFGGRSLAQLSETEKEAVDGRITFCTFHPAYTYEEFIEGYRPIVTDSGASFKRRDGLFLEACEKARSEGGHHVLIIDEINRGHVAAVLGELLTLLEADKRDVLKVRLPLSRREFTVPRNLWIIGTMNTADRSISLLDAALRRRFGFVELMPEPEHLEASIGQLKLSSLLRVLNARVRRHVPRNARELQVGHAYFLQNGKPLQTKRQLQHVLRDDVIPLLSEYCFENFEALREVLGETLVDAEEGSLNLAIVNDEEKLYGALCELVGLAPEDALGEDSNESQVNGEDSEAEGEDESGGEGGDEDSDRVGDGDAK